jgi:hypothetical protein
MINQISFGSLITIDKYNPVKTIVNNSDAYYSINNIDNATEYDVYITDNKKNKPEARLVDKFTGSEDLILNIPDSFLTDPKALKTFFETLFVNAAATRTRQAVELRTKAKE